MRCLTAVLLSASGSALAHPGHGVAEAHSHGLELWILAAVVLLIGAILFRR